METISTGPITSGMIITAWAIIQSFGLEYLWFVKDWFAALDTGKKKTVNAAGVFIVTAIAYGLSLAGVIDGFTPDLSGALTALFVFLAAIGIGQGVHAGTKKSS
jgi:hypothetical protein